MEEKPNLDRCLSFKSLPFRASENMPLLGWRVVTSKTLRLISNIQRNLAGIDRERIGKWLGYAVESTHSVSIDFAISEF